MNIETKTYSDGTTATGTAPLPDHSPAGRGIRCRTMADEVLSELDSIGIGWDDDDIERIQTSLLPRVYDLLNLLAIADGVEIDLCPKCGTDEWDRITNRVAPGEVFNRCARCGNEWDAR